MRDKEGGDMMDGRGEHGGRSAYSSVGGIYRLNRTVSTCRCHRPERARKGASLHLLHLLIFLRYVSHRHEYVWIFSQQAVITQLNVEMAYFFLTLYDKKIYNLCNLYVLSAIGYW